VHCLGVTASYDWYPCRDHQYENGKKTQGGNSSVVYPASLERVRAMNEAQPKAQTAYVPGAQRYVIGRVRLSGSGNPQIVISDSALWHWQSGNDIESSQS